MGISDAFNPTAADFTGISGKHINAVKDKKASVGFLHKAPVVALWRVLMHK